MKKLLTFALLLCAFVNSVTAQRINHNFLNVSMSEALKYIQQQTNKHKIIFIYNELEDFKVTSYVKGKSVPDAIKQVIGFYPIRITQNDDEIYVECTHKSDRHLTGIIVDENGQALPYANISILNPTDSTYLTGGLSNESGYFAIPYEQDQVLARISYVGYKTIYKICYNGNIGRIRLHPDSYTLNGIEVKGQRPLVRIKDDAFVTTVENSYLSKMGTVTDVLDHIPGVILNGGNIEVLGRGTPLIYINGRQLRNGSELSQLNSDQIKDIEVIMTPGAKYDATVKAVIRIKTIRPIGEGFSFDNMTMVGVNHKLFGQEEINLNYRKGGLDIFGMVDYEDFSMNNINTSQQNTYLPNLYLQQQGNTDYSTNAKIKMGKIGLNYMINDKQSFGITYTAASRPLHENSSISTNTFSNDQNDDMITGNGEEDTDNMEHILSGYYSNQADKWSLDANADILLQRETVDALTIENATQSESRTITTNNVVRNHLYAAKIVAGHPIWKGKLEFGTEGYLVHRTDQFDNLEHIIYESDTKIEESNAAAFAELTQQFGKLSTKLGFRYEYVNSRYFEQGIRMDDQCRTYSNLLPSAMLAYPFGKVTARLSYSRNINRPSFGQLSSNLLYINRYLYESGNPYLRPMFRDNISLAVNYRWLTAMVDYAHVKDYIISSYSTYADDPTISLLRKDNTHGFDNLQAMVFVSPTFGKYHPQLMVATQWQNLEVQYKGQIMKMNDPMLIIRFNNAINLPYDVWLNADFSWRSAGDTENIHLLQSCQFNISLYKSFWNDRFSIKLACDDLFASMRQKLTIYSDVREFYLDKHIDNRKVKLTIRYNFNPAKSKYRGQGAGNDAKGRL